MCEWGNDVMVKVPVGRNPKTRTGFRWDWRPIDACIAPVIKELNQERIYTTACCCGHFKHRRSILYWDIKDKRRKESK